MYLCLYIYICMHLFIVCTCMSLYCFIRIGPSGEELKLHVLWFRHEAFLLPDGALLPAGDVVPPVVDAGGQEGGDETPGAGPGAGEEGGDETPGPAEEGGDEAAGAAEVGGDEAAAAAEEGGDEAAGAGGVEDDRPARELVGDQWPAASATTPWSIAPIRKKGVQIGWGATCACHTNAAEVAAGKKLECKKQLHKSKDMTFEQCRLLVLQWLVRGHTDIEVGDAEGRTKHVRAMQVRKFAPMSEEELTAAALAIWP